MPGTVSITGMILLIHNLRLAGITPHFTKKVTMFEKVKQLLNMPGLAGSVLSGDKILLPAIALLWEDTENSLPVSTSCF